MKFKVQKWSHLLLLKNLTFLFNSFPTYFKKLYILNSYSFELTSNLENLYNLCFFFKYSSLFQLKYLKDISTIDYLGWTKRFYLFYLVGSFTTALNFFIKVNISAYNAPKTLKFLYKNAKNFESEITDMFGIFFKGSLYTGHLLTDYGFQGFPLRRDFPLSGFLEVNYDYAKKKNNLCWNRIQPVF